MNAFRVHALRLTLLLLPLGTHAADPCRIQVIDAENGWPVPLVKLETVHHVAFFTDNAGVAAFDVPELMGRETWLTVSSDSYQVDADGFGFRGVRITPQSGKTIEIKIKRTSIAKRLGRLTGGGLFAESQKCGDYLDWLESGVLGSDSVQNAVHRGRMFWAWGDTKVAHYPLGLFHMTSATSELRPLAKFAPPIKPALDYFRDDKGRVRNVADMGSEGPTWISGYVSLPDAAGEPRLVGCYAKIRGFLEAYRHGLCVWNDAGENFESVKILWEKEQAGADQSPPPLPVGHPVFWTDSEGQAWLLFGDPLPTLKMPATFEAWSDPSQWQQLHPDKTVPAVDGSKVEAHRGSVAWNEWRQRWVTVFGQSGGQPSQLGEIWYAEADSPLGPWGPAIKVLSHQSHTFYNPRLHPEFTPQGSPILLFEGTYTNTFTRKPVPPATPRHDYNQILYRLDLDDAALAPASSD